MGTQEFDIVNVTGGIKRAGVIVGGRVDRGNIAVADWHETGSKAVLNTDGADHDLDCSAVVPAGATAIIFRIFAKDDHVSVAFSIRSKASTDVNNQVRAVTQAASVGIEAFGSVECDSDRVVQYRGSNEAWEVIAVNICGWYI